jgi:glycolate oxidase FAD binding subunit
MSSYKAVKDACLQVREATDTDQVDGVQPSLVAYPGSTEEAAALVKVAAAHSLTLVARGNGTKLSWGMPPQQVDLVIDTTKMNRVVSHAAGDLVVIAEAGVPLDRLQQQLASADQRLALDETIPGSTIGGIVATSPSGPRRMANGTVRDLLIGVTIVRADGAIAKSGGKVVKNVAGYDLGKLVIGSYGTLGLITQAIFRLHPVAVSSRWVRATADSCERAAAMIFAVLHSQLAPVALEVDWPPDGSLTIAVLIEGTKAGVDARTYAVSQLLGTHSEQADNPGWISPYPWQSGDTALKLTCALSAVPSVLSAAQSQGVSIRGSAGVGVLYGGVPRATPADHVRHVVGQLRDTCAYTGGSVVILDAPNEVKTAMDVWGPVNGLELMHRVKEQFDPDRRLAPGRFVGGI